MMQRALLLLSLAAPAAAVFNPGISPFKLKSAVKACLALDSTGDCTDLAGTPVPDGQGSGNYGAIGEWDVSDITSMSYLFSGASDFNQDLSRWDVSNVRFMQSMFRGATSFNQDISFWNVGTVAFMQDMFRGATSFRQDLSPWDVSKVTNMNNMFLETDTNFPYNWSPSARNLCGCAWYDAPWNAARTTASETYCYDFTYPDLSAAPDCYHEGRKTYIREQIRPFIAQYPNIVSEEWEAATASCGS